MTQKTCAVIFDIDGVLIDSYQAHQESWQRIARKHGHEMTDDQFAATFGQTSREIIRQLWATASLTDQSVAEIDDEKEAAFREIIADNYPIMPGARELINMLHAAGFSLAVGSSGPPENVQLTLDRLNRENKITAAVSGDDVQRGKPDPEVFQIAARRLQVPPSACAVIEDAAVGIAAANAAGMLSIALVSTGHSPSEYGEADHVLQRLNELSPERVRDWLAN
ncbi:MAG: HAD family phosphatase [Planctomycetales bacterium]